MNVQRWSRALGGILLLAIFLIAGCAAPASPEGQKEHEIQVWRGRLALQVLSEPPQSFFASFELSGTPTQGELSLFSPLGTTLAQLRWTPGGATLVNNGQAQSFESLEALATQATGAALPITALFQWLAGVQTTADGWAADLSQLEAGRLSARRIHPAPPTELRLVLER